jgi:hypothetical protein
VSKQSACRAHQDNEHHGRSRQSMRIIVPTHTRVQDGRAFACQSLDGILAEGMGPSLLWDSRRVERVTRIEPALSAWE